MANKQSMELNILYDSLEKQPLDFSKCRGVASQNRKRLPVGDYTETSLASICVIERKGSAAEFASNCSEARWIKVLEKLNALAEPHIVFSFSFDELYSFPRNSDLPFSVKRSIRINGRYIISLITDWQRQYPNINWHFAGSIEGARDLTLAILKESYKTHNVSAETENATKSE